MRKILFYLNRARIGITTPRPLSMFFICWGILAGLTFGLPCLTFGQNVLDDTKIVPLNTQASFAAVPKKSGELTIAYLPPATEFNFYLDVWKGISAAAAETKNNAFQLAPQTDNPPEQMKMLKKVIKQGVDAIILSTHDEKSAAPLIAQAVQKGIIVIIVNSDTLNYSTPVHAVVGYSQRNGTFNLGQYALSLTQGKAMKVGILEGEPGYHSTERVGGFEKAIQDSALNIVARSNGHWNTEGGYAAAVEMFRANPDIGMVFAANDFEIIGAESALKTLGNDQVLLFGNDGVSEVMSHIANGAITATVYTNPVLMGKVALHATIESIAGNFKGGFVETPTVVMTKANVTDYMTKSEQEALSSSLTDMLVVSEPLQDLTNKDGTGLYWDILRAIYESQGIKVKVEAVPLKRAQYLIEKQAADVMLGHYRGDSKNMIFPQWHYNAQTISAIFKKGSLNWNGEQSLVGKKVAWIRGADYNKYLSVPVSFEEKSDHMGPLLMLQSDRIDVFLDDNEELLKTFQLSADRLQQAGFSRNDYQVETLLVLKLYPAFADTTRGRKLADIFDNQMPQLISSGKLKAMFDKWKLHSFPF